MKNKLFKSKVGLLFSGAYLSGFLLILILNLLGPSDGLSGLLVVLFGAPWIIMIAEASDSYGITLPPIIGVGVFMLSIALNATILYRVGALLSRFLNWINRYPTAPPE